jgi:hypothetical protein
MLAYAVQPGRTDSMVVLEQRRSAEAVNVSGSNSIAQRKDGRAWAPTLNDCHNPRKGCPPSLSRAGLSARQVFGTPTQTRATRKGDPMETTRDSVRLIKETLISMLHGNSIGACQRFHSTEFGVIASSDGRGWPSAVRCDSGAALLFAPSKADEKR